MINNDAPCIGKSSCVRDGRIERIALSSWRCCLLSPLLPAKRADQRSITKHGVDSDVQRPLLLLL